MLPFTAFLALLLLQKASGSVQRKSGFLPGKGCGGISPIAFKDKVLSMSDLIPCTTVADGESLRTVLAEIETGKTLEKRNQEEL